ncbi:methionine synthase [Allosaccharopolyspora coralli]|uniref:Methionine synthase n=1 Tax=Allosaccharopolyspora coralli TaxID=2665642 RepID=A0A5Q3QEK5_9PSEU|nr:methionine synthase [Allosaccharopolyspora coralli]QGK72380.1 methionine synthase [Allosaccharopolyspora coralli]
MTDFPWNPGTATATGSMPGVDAEEAARISVGELPDLVPFPELPARGVGADSLGRTAGMLVDLAVEVVPSGYRVTAKPGRDQRRAQDLMRWDLDAMEQAVAEAGAPPALLKVQAAGPWTLAAGIELERGHRVLTDHGALRDFTTSLIEGLRAHVQRMIERTGARVVLQLDEPTLPRVLRGDLPTPSGYGTVPAVPVPEVESLLGEVIAPLREATGEPVIAHCCARRPPVGLLRRAGAGAVSLDATGMGEVTGSFADELGEAWDGGTSLFLGLVPGTDPSERPDLRELALPAFDLAARLGFSRRILAEGTVATTACGLAGASPEWARRALSLVRDLGKLFVDEAENPTG